MKGTCSSLSPAGENERASVRERKRERKAEQVGIVNPWGVNVHSEQFSGPLHALIV